MTTRLEAETRSHKYCKRCDQTLPVSDFGIEKKKRSRPGAPKAYCRPCQKSYQRAQYEANRQLYGHRAKSSKARAMERDLPGSGASYMFNDLGAQERFWRFVERKKPDECWLWIGGKDLHGYGGFWTGARLQRASRYSLEHKIQRRLLRSELACHSCDNPPCVNPDHLFVGSYKDNAEDAGRKGRNRRQLTLEQARFVREQLPRYGLVASLARQFNVHPSVVAGIRKGTTYRYVGGLEDPNEVLALLSEMG